MASTASEQIEAIGKYCIRSVIVSALCHGSVATSATCESPKEWSSHYQNSTVFRDRIRNGQLDGLERPATTCDDGRFDPPKGAAPLLLTNGTELSTGRTNPLLLGATLGSKGIGSLSSLWQVLRDSKTSEKAIRRLFGVKKSMSLAAYKPQCPSNATPKSLVWLRFEAQTSTLLQLTHALAMLESWPLPASPIKIGANRYADPLIARLASAIKARPERPVNLAQTETIASVLATLAPPGSSGLLPASEVIAALNQRATTADGATLLGLIRLRAAASDLVSAGKLAALATQFTPEDFDVRLQKLAALPCAAPTAAPVSTVAPKPAPSSPRPTPKTPLPLPVPSTPIPEHSNPPKPPVTPIPEPASADAPVITAFLEDTGDDDSDGITNDNMPTISGTVPEGMQTVSVYMDDAELGTASPIDRIWSYSMTEPLRDGRYALTARGRLRDKNNVVISPTKELLIISTTAKLSTQNFSGLQKYIFNNTDFPGQMPPTNKDPFQLTFIDNGLPLTLTAYLWKLDPSNNQSVAPSTQSAYKAEIISTEVFKKEFALPGEKLMYFRIFITESPPPGLYTVILVSQDRAGNRACIDNSRFGSEYNLNCKDREQLDWQPIEIRTVPSASEVPLAENPFVLDTTITHDFQFLDLLRSARIMDGQHSQNIIGYNGPGNLSFWWRVSSEENFDFLRLYVDDIEVSTVPGISGEADWQFVETQIPTGAHVVKWEYSKDASFSSGDDAAWLDEITFK